MMAKRTPPPDSGAEPALPHDHDRENRQPYAKEAEDYGRGVATPPKEQTGRRFVPGQAAPARRRKKP